MFLCEKQCAPSGKVKSKSMASYHCTVKVGGKGKAGSHSAYISREGKYSGRERYEDLESTAYGNMPKWAEHNPAHFWGAADEHERVNGATYREIEVALPRELTPAQRRELVEDFIEQELGERHAYQWAIHTPTAALEGGEQPHAHIMYSERTLDGIDRDPEQYFKRYNGKSPERGGCRKDSAGTEERLQATRERWASVQNAHLERHGHAARVDHRSLKAQGIDREPERHIGPSRTQDLTPEAVAALLERRAAEGQLERLQLVMGQIDLSGEIKAAKAERERQREAEAEAQRQADEQARRAAAKAAQDAAKAVEWLGEGRTVVRDAFSAWKAEKAEKAAAMEAERQAKLEAQRLELQRQAEARAEAERVRQVEAQRQALLAEIARRSRGRNGPGQEGPEPGF